MQDKDSKNATCEAIKIENRLNFKKDGGILSGLLRWNIWKVKRLKG